MKYKRLTQKNKRKQGEVTRERILASALSYSEEFGYSTVTAGNIAKRLDLTPSNIFYYFGNIDNFHNAIMTEAISRSNYIVIAQGIAAGNPIALSANKELQRKALLKVSRCHYMKRLES